MIYNIGCHLSITGDYKKMGRRLANLEEIPMPGFPESHVEESRKL